MYKLKEGCLQSITEQVVKEFNSEMIYLQMASILQEKGYEGMCHWMKKQAAEEHSHALKFIDYIEDRGNIAHIKPIPAPILDTTDVSCLGLFKKALEHEVYIRDSIYAIKDVACNEEDEATCEFLLWFIKEQVEEIAVADMIVRRLMLAGDNSSALLLIDEKLGER